VVLVEVDKEDSASDRHVIRKVRSILIGFPDKWEILL
jgi:hypothetical protein